MTEPTTLTALLARRAGHTPNGPALLYGDTVVTFGELYSRSRSIARGLQALGVGRGDRVALWLPNTPAWLACFFACARLGAIVLATNTRFRSTEMEDILGRSEAKALIYWPAFRGIGFSDIVEDLGPSAIASLRALIAYRESGDAAPPAKVHGIAVHEFGTLLTQSALADDFAHPDLGCLMFTTSGTTKAPKFVLHHQRSIVHHAHDVARAFRYLEPDTVGLGVLPFCGTYGFSTALAPLTAGAPVVVTASYDASTTVKLIRRHKVTNTNLSGDMMGSLLAAAEGADNFANIRVCGCGSGCPQWIAAAAKRGLRLTGLYGSSEMQALFSHQNEIDTELAERAAGGGRPVSAIAQVRARDIATGAILAHGESGALEIRAPSQMLGYLGNERATSETFTADGFVRTGDLGYTLVDGRFIYQARMGDALRLAGFLVSPAQIEAVIEEHPSVQACQVVGIDTARGTRPIAFVIGKPGMQFDAQAIGAFARARMAHYKVPERIVCLDAFPTVQSANAVKIQKAKLREMAQALPSES